MTYSYYQMNRSMSQTSHNYGHSHTSYKVTIIKTQILSQNHKFSRNHTFFLIYILFISDKLSILSITIICWSHIIHFIGYQCSSSHSTTIITSTPYHHLQIDHGLKLQVGAYNFINYTRSPYPKLYQTLISPFSLRHQCMATNSTPS